MPVSIQQAQGPSGSAGGTLTFTMTPPNGVQANDLHIFCQQPDGSSLKVMQGFPAPGGATTWNIEAGNPRVGGAGPKHFTIKWTLDRETVATEPVDFTIAPVPPPPSPKPVPWDPAQERFLKWLLLGGLIAAAAAAGGAYGAGLKFISQAEKKK